MAMTASRPGRDLDVYLAPACAESLHAALERLGLVKHGHASDT